VCVCVTYENRHTNVELKKNEDTSVCFRGERAKFSLDVGHVF